jgi:hypothetical protein
VTWTAACVSRAHSRPRSAPRWRFRLITVNTTRGSEYERVEEMDLTLRLADSVERADARISRIGHHRRRDLQLVGHVAFTPDTVKERPYVTEVDDGVLYLLCRDCFDTPSWPLKITAVSATSFAGTWRLGLAGGLAVREDKHRRPLPDPGGYFGAVRETGH